MQDLVPKEVKRLEELQRAAMAGVASFGGNNLTMADLLLMLRHDPGLRTLIAEIARAPQDAQPAQAAQPAPPPIALAPAPGAGLEDGLAGPLRLLALLEGDQVLCTDWLGSLQPGDAGQLTRLIANAAHWDRIEALWDVLAQRCKQEQRAATADETAVVRESMHIHNLLWEGRHATVVSAAAGAAFDFGVHERGNAAGQQVCATWLPGLKNAAGQLRKKTLVHTR